MKSVLKPLLISTLLTTAAVVAYAQGAGAPAHGGPGVHQRHMDPAKMQEMVVKRQAELKAKLQLSAIQDGAWASYVAAMQPPADMATRMGRENRQKMRDEMEKLTTPQRIDRMNDAAATAFRLRRIGFVFQRFYLMPALSAAENVELPMAEARLPREERRARVRELLGYVGLAERAHHRPSQRSGGEQQRVAIARALANRPALLLADEPTGELDAATGLEMIELFRRLNRDGTTIVVVTHDAQMAAAAGRRIQMRDGAIISGGLA